MTSNMLLNRPTTYLTIHEMRDISHRLITASARNHHSPSYMNFDAKLINPPPPDEPPISLCIYIFNAISPACWTAPSFDAPSATFPLEAWLSVTQH
jgi:hypothetical protein